MAKPSEHTRWATSGLITDPPSGNKDSGWVDGASAPADYANWLANNAYNWERWLDAGDSEAQRRLIELAGEVLDLAPSPSTGSDVSTSKYAFALSARSAYPRQGSANNKIKISRGTLFQAVSASSMLAYTFDGTDEVTIADAAGATPRVDLVQVKIEPDATTDGIRTKKTISVKQGTPAASPRVPDLDAGYVAYCTVVVGASYAHASAFKIDDVSTADAVIHDQRLPIGLRTHSVAARNFQYWDTTSAAWSLSLLTDILTASGGSPGIVAALCPSDASGRLVAAGMSQSQASVTPGPTQLIMRIGINSSGTQINPSLNGISVGVGVINTPLHIEDVFGDWDLVHVPLAGPTVLPSTADHVGCPTWTNGHRCWTPTAEGGTFGAIENTVAFSMSGCATGSKAFRAVFRVAGCG